MKDLEVLKIVRAMIFQVIINIDSVDGKEIKTETDIKINKVYNKLDEIKRYLDREIKTETNKNNNELFKSAKGK